MVSRSNMVGRSNKRPRSDGTNGDPVPVGTKVVVTKKGRHFHHHTGVELLDGEGTSTTLKRGDFVTMVPSLDGEGTIINGFSLSDRKAFFEFVMSFGISDGSWKKAHAAMADKSYDQVCSYAVLFLKHLGNPVGEGPLYADAALDQGVPQKLDEIHSVLERIAVLHLLHRKALQFEATEELAPAQKEWLAAIKTCASKKYQMKSIGAIKMPMGWPPELDRRLIRAVVVCGYGNWEEFVTRADLELLPMLCPALGPDSFEVLEADERYLVSCIVKGRTADIAMSVAKEYRTRHNAGENLSAFNLEPRHVHQVVAAPPPETIKEEDMPETRRQMVDEWSYHEPMVGVQYQAEIPNLLKRCRENRYSLQRQAILQENYTVEQEGTLVWDCHRHDPEVLSQYLLFVQDFVNVHMPEAVADPASKFNVESSLDFLHHNGGQYDKAMESLVALGCDAICRPQTVWEPHELDVFAAAYEHYGKDFRSNIALAPPSSHCSMGGVSLGSIADSLPNKTWMQVTDFYFKHKTDKFFMPPKATKADVAAVGSPSLAQQLTAEEREISKAADLAPSKLLVLKQKLVDQSAREGCISRSQACKLANQAYSGWPVANTSKDTVNKLYDLLVSRGLVKPVSQSADDN